jgi:hypothetical protein
VNNVVDNTVPTVSLTAPANNATVSGTVSVTASASDNVGVAGVQFKLDGANLGAEVTTAPYAVSWNTTSAANGSHTLTAVARDAAGNTATATNVTVTVNNAVLGLVGAWGFNEGTGTTTADVSGLGNNGTLSNAAWTTAGKFGKALSFNGTNAWVTIADSASLHLTTAMTLEAWVEPTAALSAWRSVLLKEAGTEESYAIYGNDDTNHPSGWAYVNGTYYPARGTASLAVNTWTHLATTYDGTTLKLYVNGVLTGSQAVSGSLLVSTGALRIGGNSIWGEYFTGLVDEVRVYNRALSATEVQTDMNTPIASDTQPPTAPASLTATGSVSSVSLSWPAATDNVGVDHYNVYRSTTSGFTPGSGNLVGQSATTAYTDAGLTPGTYYYAVNAADAAGNVSPPSPQASAVVTGDVTPPTVSLTSPSGGATVSGIVTVSANASDDVGVVGVQFLLNGSNLQAEDTTTPYSVSWNTTTAANGTYTLTAVARDAAGHSTTSAPVSVTVNNVVDTTAPTVSLTAPANNATVSGTVSVTASASDNVGVAGVQFKLDGANLGAEVTTAPYSVSWTTTSATNGSHVLTAVARDAAGNTATATSVTVTVNNITGLVGAWGFEEGSGTTTADASGHTLTGTLSNATWTTAGKFGKALAFNGTNAWVTVADNTLLHLTNGMTVEAWVKPAATSTNWTSAVMKERGTNGLAYALYATDGANKPPAGYINRGADVEAAGTSVLPLNTWSHLAVTYDGANIRLYVNGTQVGTKAQTGNITSSTSPLRFGGDSPWGEYFNGLIDEVRVYSVALTAAQIQTDMNTPVGGPQLAAEGPVPDGTAPALTLAELSPVAAEAVRRWQAVGLPPAQMAALRGVQFRIVDLGPTGVLGLTPTGGSVVELDDNAAGRGWFVDPTPGDDAEFPTARTPTELSATTGPAAGRYDLLTVVMHELGHVLGQDDLDPGAVPHDLLTATLGTGTRRLPTPADAAAPVPMPAAPLPSATTAALTVGPAAVPTTPPARRAGLAPGGAPAGVVPWLFLLPMPGGTFEMGPPSPLAVSARTTSGPSPVAGRSGPPDGEQLPATPPPVAPPGSDPTYLGGLFTDLEGGTPSPGQGLRPFPLDPPDGQNQ